MDISDNSAPAYGGKKIIILCEKVFRYNNYRYRFSFSSGYCCHFFVDFCFRLNTVMWTYQNQWECVLSWSSPVMTAGVRRRSSSTLPSPTPTWPVSMSRGRQCSVPLGIEFPSTGNYRLTMSTVSTTFLPTLGGKKEMLFRGYAVDQFSWFSRI